MTKKHFSNLKSGNQGIFNAPLQSFEDASEVQIDLRMPNCQELGSGEQVAIDTDIRNIGFAMSIGKSGGLLAAKEHYKEEDLGEEKQELRKKCDKEKAELAEDCEEDKQKLCEECNKEKEKLREDYENQIKKIEEYKKDCGIDETESFCVPDCKIFKTFRNKPIVSSVKTDEKVGGANESAWFFKGEDLFHNLPVQSSSAQNSPKDKISSSVTGKNANYLRVLPCNKGESHKLELCNKNGQVFTKDAKGVAINLTKCNLLEPVHDLKKRIN